jgi:nicotinate phosphoribosyltransferase
MRDGRRLHPRPALAQARAETAARVAALPARLRRLDAADPPYRVAISAALAADEREVRARVAAGARDQGGGAPAR